MVVVVVVVTQRTPLYRFDLEQQAWKTAPLVHNNILWRGNAAGWIFKTAENEELWIHGGHLGNDTQPRQIVLRLHTGLTSLVRRTVRGINVTRRKWGFCFTGPHVFFKAQLQWIRHVAMRMWNVFFKFTISFPGPGLSVLPETKWQDLRLCRTRTWNWSSAFFPDQWRI